MSWESSVTSWKIFLDFDLLRRMIHEQFEIQDSNALSLSWNAKLPSPTRKITFAQVSNFTFSFLAIMCVFFLLFYSHSRFGHHRSRKKKRRAEQQETERSKKKKFSETWESSFMRLKSSFNFPLRSLESHSRFPCCRRSSLALPPPTIITGERGGGEQEDWRWTIIQSICLANNILFTLKLFRCRHRHRRRRVQPPKMSNLSFSSIFHAIEEDLVQFPTLILHDIKL